LATRRQGVANIKPELLLKFATFATTIRRAKIG
jgi:hypothetical protein